MNKVAINGFGRIGRMVLRSIIENKTKGIKVVAINNRADSGTSAFLLEKDSIHGNLNASIQFDKKSNSIQEIVLEEFIFDVVFRCFSMEDKYFLLSAILFMIMGFLTHTYDILSYFLE